MLKEAQETVSVARLCAQIRQQERIRGLRAMCSTGLHFWDQCRGLCFFIDSVERHAPQPVILDGLQQVTKC